MTIKIFTIGFKEKDAKEFFESLKSNNVKRVIDIRLNNNNQLAGFTKKNHLQYFLDKICGIEYFHEPLLAPTKELRKKVKELKKKAAQILLFLKEQKQIKIAKEHFKDKKKSLEEKTFNYYKNEFKRIIIDRKIENLNSDFFNNACLLCAEKESNHCHRNIITNYLKEKWNEVEVEIIHL